MGKLSFIDNAVDTTTGTVQLKATFDNAERPALGGAVRHDVAASVRRGQRARGADAGRRHRASAAPTSTSSTQSDTARQRPVIVERTSGGLSIIASGIHDGDRVVTRRAVAAHAGCAGQDPRAARRWRWPVARGGGRRGGVAGAVDAAARRRPALPLAGASGRWSAQALRAARSRHMSLTGAVHPAAGHDDVCS